MVYRLEFRPRAQRDFANLKPDVRDRLETHIDALARDPRPPGCRKLHGVQNLWRIRIGDYRIVYQIHDAGLLIVVITIGHRREVYR